MWVIELDDVQARRAHPWPPNVHRTPYGRYLGRFNLFGERWYTGCFATVGQAVRAVAVMRQRLRSMRAQGVPISALRRVEIERP
jgi:hypothetical protein